MDTLGIVNRLAKRPNKYNKLAFAWLRRSIDNQVSWLILHKVLNCEEPMKAFLASKNIYFGCRSLLESNDNKTITSVAQITPLNAAQLYNDIINRVIPTVKQLTEESN